MVWDHRPDLPFAALQAQQPNIKIITTGSIRAFQFNGFYYLVVAEGSRLSALHGNGPTDPLAPPRMICTARSGAIRDDNYVMSFLCSEGQHAPWAPVAPTSR